MLRLLRAVPPLLAILAGCAGSDADRVVVVGATSHITAIVHAVGGDRVDAVTICGAGMCPGHFDIRPSHVTAANRARLVINQGWETWFPDLQESIHNPEVRVVTAATPGNWMLPDVHRRALAELTDLLCGMDTASVDSFRLRAARYAVRVDSAAAAARKRLGQVDKPLVMAADRQAPLLRWLGFRVIATYGRPEEFTAAELGRLAQVGVDSGIGLVVDNLQSGPDALREMARELGAKHVTLTNFPFDDDYPATLAAYADTLARLLE